MSRRDVDRELLELLDPGLEPARAELLRQRLERDPVLAERFSDLESHWRALEPPPAGPAPAGFAAEVVERAAKLSKEKYCSASIMLAKTADITYDVEIINEA